MVCVEQNLGREAYESMKKAVELDPDNPFVNYAMGAVAMHRHEPSESLPYFEKYVRLVRTIRAATSRWARRASTATSSTRPGPTCEARRRPRRRPAPTIFLGRIARQPNDLTTARREIELALQLNAGLADAWAELGLIQTRSNEYGPSGAVAHEGAVDRPGELLGVGEPGDALHQDEGSARDAQAARLAALRRSAKREPRSSSASSRPSRTRDERDGGRPHRDRVRVEVDGSTSRLLLGWMLAAACFGALTLGQSIPPTRRIPAASPNAAANVRFSDVTAAAGLSGFRHVSGGADKNYIIETTGSGVALWDFDGDGLLDIYLVNGSTLEPRAGGPPRAALFRNNGDRTFRDVTAAAGVANERWGQGVCAGDIDNDGDPDLYVTNFGHQSAVPEPRRGPVRRRRRPLGRRGRELVDGLRVRRLRWRRLARSYVAGYVALDVRSRRRRRRRRHRSSAARARAGAAEEAGGMGAAYSAGAASCTYRGLR